MEPRPRKPRYLPSYCVEDRDAQGNPRIRFRRPGFPKIRLHGSPWSPEFMKEHGAAMEAYEKAKDGPAGAQDQKLQVVVLHSFRWGCEKYFASPEFQGRAESTKRTRRRNLEWTWDRPHDPEKPNHLFGN